MDHPVCAFWRAAARRLRLDTLAFFSSHKKEVWLTVVLPIVVGAPIHLVTRGPTAMLGELEIIATYTLAPLATLTLLVIIWNAIAAPARLFIDKKGEADIAHAEVQSLQQQASPRLQFTWRPEDNKHLEYVQDAQIGRVAVKNLSKTQTVRNVDVTLIDYRRDGEFWYTTIDRKILANSIDQPIVNINPWREENFNLFRAYVRSLRDGAGLELTFGPFVNGSGERIQSGTYKVKITASGELNCKCV